MSAPARGGSSGNQRDAARGRGGRGGGVVGSNVSSPQRGRGNNRAVLSGSTRGGRGRGRGSASTTTNAAPSTAEGLLQRIRSGTIKRGTENDAGATTTTRGRAQTFRGVSNVRGRGRGRGHLSQTFNDGPTQPPEPVSRSGSPAPVSSSQRDFMNDAIAKFQLLKQNREAERSNAIRDGFLSDPEKKTSLDKAITPVGTCTDMCPEFERVERIVQNMVDKAEKIQDVNGGRDIPVEDRMIKRFRRSAAGYDEQLPSDIRTPETLRRTLDYLFDKVIEGGERLASIHKFVWDRTRGIRNDFSIQQVTKAEDVRIAVQCYERIARFHILSLHQLSNPANLLEGENFDVHQEREQLNNTLLSLMYYYEDHRLTNPFPNEAEFRAYCILFELQSQHPDLEDRMQSWPKDLLQDRRVQTAFALYSAAGNTLFDQGPLRPSAAFSIAQANGGAFWTLISSKAVSYMMACVAELHFSQIRFVALDAVWRAGKSAPQAQQNKSQEWTMAELTTFLCFDTDDQTVEFCEGFGLAFATNEHNEQYLDFAALGDLSLDKSSIPSQQVFSYTMVEEKRYRRSLVSVINGVTAADAIRQGLTESDEDTSNERDDVMSADDQAMFFPEKPAPTPKSTFSPFMFNPEASTFSSKFGESTSTSSTISTAFGQPSVSDVAVNNQHRPGLTTLDVTSNTNKDPNPTKFQGFNFETKAAQPQQSSSFFTGFKFDQTSSISVADVPPLPAASLPIEQLSGQSSATSANRLDEKAQNQSSFPFFNSPSNKIGPVESSKPVQATSSKPLFFAAPQEPSFPTRRPENTTTSASPYSFPSPSQSASSEPLAFKANFPASATSTFPKLANSNIARTGSEVIKTSNELQPPPDDTKNTVTSRSFHSDTTQTFPGFNFPSQLPQPSRKELFPASPSVPKVPSLHPFETSGGDKSQAQEPLQRSTTPPSTPLVPSVNPPFSDQDKDKLVEALAVIALRQPNGLVQQFTEFLLPNILQPIVLQHQKEVFHEKIASIKMRVLARKFGQLWRSLTWRGNLGRRAQNRRQLMAQAAKTDELKKKRRAEELDEIIQAGREKKRIQEEQNMADQQRAQAAVRKPPTSTSVQEEYATGRKRKSLSEYETPANDSTQKVSKTHKRSRTMGHPDLSASTQSVLTSAKKSNASFRTSVFSGPPANLGRSTTSQHLHTSQSGQKVDTTRTDYFRLKALGIDPGLPVRQRGVVKLGGGTNFRRSSLSSQRSTSIDKTSPRVTPTKVGVSMQASKFSPQNQQQRLQNKPPSDKFGDGEDDFLRQLRSARAALADDEEWFKTQVSVLEAEEEAQQNAPQAKQRTMKVQVNPRISSNGLAEINGIEYRPSEPKSGHTLSATESRIRQTGAHGFATKLVGAALDYVPVAMSKQSAARYSTGRSTGMGSSNEGVALNGSAKQSYHVLAATHSYGSATSVHRNEKVIHSGNIDSRFRTAKQGRASAAQSQNQARNAYALLQATSDEENEEGVEETVDSTDALETTEGYQQDLYQHSNGGSDEEADDNSMSEGAYTHSNQHGHHYREQEHDEGDGKDDNEGDYEDDEAERHPEDEYDDEDDQSSERSDLKDGEDDDDDDPLASSNHHTSLGLQRGHIIGSGTHQQMLRRGTTSSSNGTSAAGTGLSSRAISTGPGASVDDALVLSDSD